MRTMAWSLLIALGASEAFASDAMCCRLFGFNAAPLLGENAVACGSILDAEQRREAESATLEDRQVATQCALAAQARGSAFVYTYRLLISPDVDLVHQAVFGMHGERLLLRMGLYQGENIRTVEACATLTVQADGRVAKQGCRLRQGVLD